MKGMKLHVESEKERERERERGRERGERIIEVGTTERGSGQNILREFGELNKKKWKLGRERWSGALMIWDRW
mgnify:CR=1 FL=1